MKTQYGSRFLEPLIQNLYVVWANSNFNKPLKATLAGEFTEFIGIILEEYELGTISRQITRSKWYKDHMLNPLWTKENL